MADFNNIEFRNETANCHVSYYDKPREILNLWLSM